MLYYKLMNNRLQGMNDRSQGEGNISRSSFILPTSFCEQHELKQCRIAQRKFLKMSVGSFCQHVVHICTCVAEPHVPADGTTNRKANRRAASLRLHEATVCIKRVR